MLPIRTLGTSLSVGAMGFGCMSFTLPGVTWDADAAATTIHRALDLGVTLIDTADMYGHGTNEQFVGQAIAGRRDEVVLATKFGIMAGPDGTWAGISGHPDYVRSACDSSLARLGVDHIDLYYQHRVDRDVPVEETWGALADLVAHGKVIHLGICEALPATIRRAHAVHPVTAIQSEWSLWTRDPERTGSAKAAAELGIGFVPYSPLGRGMLAGQLGSPADLPQGDYRSALPRFQADNFTHNLTLVDRVRDLAERKKISASRVALAWVLARGPSVVPIPGTRRVDHLVENVAAVAVDLTADEITWLDDAMPIGSAHGDRYGDMSTVDV